jgi:hypothetical protein
MKHIKLSAVVPTVAVNSNAEIKGFMTVDIYGKITLLKAYRQWIGKS